MKFTYIILILSALLSLNRLNGQDFSGTHFRNGDLIPYIENAEEWKRAGENKQPAWCYYNNDPANGPQYGKLYNWYAVADSRGLCPVGWHVPSDNEWTLFANALGGKDVAGSKMKSASGWKYNGNGNNSSDFSGLPGGARDFYDGGDFSSVGSNGYWWSSSVCDHNGANDAWGRNLNYFNVNVQSTYYSKHYGFSVRCLRN